MLIFVVGVEAEQSKTLHIATFSVTIHSIATENDELAVTIFIFHHYTSIWLNFTKWFQATFECFCIRLMTVLFANVKLIVDRSITRFSLENEKSRRTESSAMNVKCVESVATGLWSNGWSTTITNILFLLFFVWDVPASKQHHKTRSPIISDMNELSLECLCAHVFNLYWTMLMCKHSTVQVPYIRK